jgi:hypothetical protein
VAVQTWLTMGDGRAVKAASSHSDKAQARFREIWRSAAVAQFTVVPEGGLPQRLLCAPAHRSSAYVLCCLCSCVAPFPFSPLPVLSCPVPFFLFVFDCGPGSPTRAKPPPTQRSAAQHKAHRSTDRGRGKGSVLTPLRSCPPVPGVRLRTGPDCRWPAVVSVCNGNAKHPHCRCTYKKVFGIAGGHAAAAEIPVVAPSLMLLSLSSVAVLSAPAQPHPPYLSYFRSAVSFACHLYTVCSVRILHHV